FDCDWSSDVCSSDLCELTVPELAQSVVLTRVPGRASRMPEAEKLATFAASGATLVIHLAVQAIGSIAAELTPFYGADCPAAVVRSEERRVGNESRSG